MIKVKKISILGLIWHLLFAKRKYLGFCIGNDAEVFEVNFPFLGADRRNKVIIHEIGHLMLNEERSGQEDHDRYDRITKHGIRQHIWENIEMREWEYTNDDFTILV